MPNGIGLSPDEKTLYVAETHQGRGSGPGSIDEPGKLADYRRIDCIAGRLLAALGV